jgi:V/A-type H+-transporting ATPase subunit F
MKKIVFVTGSDAEYGFRLTGVSHQIAKEEEIEDVLKKLMAGPETGLVVVDERLIRGIAESRLREMENRWYGMLLVLPAPEKYGAELEDYAMRLIKRAIGYHVRLKL